MPSLKIQNWLKSQGVSNPDEFKHISYMIDGVEQQLNGITNHGSFVTSVSQQDWTRASKVADATNKKWLKLYMKYMQDREDLLKEFTFDKVNETKKIIDIVKNIKLGFVSDKKKESLNEVFNDIDKKNFDLILDKPFNTKCIRDIKLKSGTIIPKGTKIKAYFSDSPKNEDILFIELPNGKNSKIHLLDAYNFLSGLNKPPSDFQLKKWNESGVAETVTGLKTDLDGRGTDGSPSWMLLMGVL